METLHSAIFTSSIGPLFLAASDSGLVALEFDRRLPGQQTIRPNPRDLRSESRSVSETESGVESKRTRAKSVSFEESTVEMQVYVRELEEYFAGQRREFTFALDLRGTDFQLSCWRALVAIPYGETRSYGDIAAPSAARRDFAPSAWPTTAIPWQLSSPAIA